MINASIVRYNNSYEEIKCVVDRLVASPAIESVFVIDNSPEPLLKIESLPVKYIFTGKNLGYGSAHNIAIKKSIKSGTHLHLVLNADILFNPKILSELESYMRSKPDVGSLMPKIFYPDGKIQYLCKLLPTPFDLIFRRFLPKSWGKKRMRRFELRASGYDKIMNVPFLSGCFMLLNVKALTKVGLFDEKIFMYGEDIDLTRRLHRKYKTIFYPFVSVVHAHAQGSYSNTHLLKIHMVNIIKYFNKWGWFFDQDRNEINKKTLNQF